MDACHKRARPIVMTTLAMGAGMTPIALGLGTDPSFRAPMAIVVIGGLITSTFLSLLVIPVVFTFVDDAVQKIKGLFRHHGHGQGGTPGGPNAVGTAGVAIAAARCVDGTGQRRIHGLSAAKYSSFEGRHPARCDAEPADRPNAARLEVEQAEGLRRRREARVHQPHHLGPGRRLERGAMGRRGTPRSAVRPRRPSAPTGAPHR